MSTARTPLRTLLFLDAATCAGMGGLLAVLTGPIAGLTALPPRLLFWAGISLFPVAIFMAITAGALTVRPTKARAASWGVVVGNVLWVAGSLLLLTSGIASPTSLGTAFVIGQAAVVALLALFEYRALRSPTSNTRP